MLKANFITADEAARKVKDGDTVCSIAMTLVSVSESILKALEKRFLESGHPSNLTLLHSCGQSDRKDGIQHFAHEGMVTRIIGSHWGLQPRWMDMIAKNQVDAYCLPQGQIAQLYHSMACGLPGKMAKVGLGTFIDPRIEGGKMNERTKRLPDIVDIIKYKDEEYMFYNQIPIDVCIIRGTECDEMGNLTTTEEAMKLEVLPAVIAAKRYGGRVIAQVKRVVQTGSLNPKEVTVPGVFIDDIVVCENPLEEHRQTSSWYFDPSYCGKVEKTFRYSKVLFKKEEIYKTKVVVLRENIFQCVQVNSLVKGDIVRLKRGEKVPLAVISLKLPYKEYKQGEIFAENTGRAIVTQQVVYPFFENVKENTGINRTVKMTENIEDKYVEKNESMKGKISLNTIGKQRKKQGRLYAAEEKEREENGGSYTENMILQEIFIRQGIYFQPDFLKKTAVEGERPIVAVGFEDIYFPSRFQKEKFQRFMQELKKTGVKYFFFTNQNRESAFSIGKQTGIVKEKREVIDRKQFLLLKNVALEKQIKSIRIYCGLSEVEKSQIIAIWRKHQQEYSKKFLQKQGRILFMSGLNQSGREKITEDCVYACCHSGSQEGDIWFKKNWRDTIVKYLTGQNIWQKFLENTQKWEGQILASLCIFMLISLLLSLYMPQQENMQKITQTGSLFCAAYIIGKEIVEEGFRKWFLKKLKNN